MNKVNNKQKREFEKAYAQHLKDNKPAYQMSETDFYEDFFYKTTGYGMVGSL